MSSVLSVEDHVITVHCLECEAQSGFPVVSSWKIGCDKSQQDLFLKKHQWCNLSLDWVLYELRINFNLDNLTDYQKLFVQQCKEEGWNIERIAKHVEQRNKAPSVAREIFGV